MDRIKFYCKKLTYNPYGMSDVEYALMARDASKKETPANTRFMGVDKISFELENKFNAIKILGAREGSSYYYYIGFELDGKMGMLQVNANEISGVLPDATMIDGYLVGEFKFVLHGSHTILIPTGTQEAGYCKYWIKKYEEIGVGTKEQLEGCKRIIQGTDKDIYMGKLILEGLKGEYYTKKFELGV